MRFSLLSIMLATALVALVVSSAIAPSEVWHQVAISSALLSLIVGLVGAYAAKGMRGVFCVGYVIGCGGYLSVTALGLIEFQGALITHVPNHWLEQQLNREEGWRLEVGGSTQMNVLTPNYKELPADSSSEDIHTFIRETSQTGPPIVLFSSARRYSKVTDETFHHMLNCWWSILLGTAMGLLAVAIRRRASSTT